MPYSYITLPYSISSKAILKKKKGEKKLSMNAFDSWNSFWRVRFDEFYLLMLYLFCSPLIICKSSNQKIRGFPSCSLDSPGSWPSCTAGKGITGLSAKAIPMYLCTTACNAVQRRGNLVKSLWTGKYPFCERERTTWKYNTGCSACHASSRCQTCFISFL